METPSIFSIHSDNNVTSHLNKIKVAFNIGEDFYNIYTRQHFPIATTIMFDASDTYKPLCENVEALIAVMEENNEVYVRSGFIEHKNLQVYHIHFNSIPSLKKLLALFENVQLIDTLLKSSFDTISIDDILNYASTILGNHKKSLIISKALSATRIKRNKNTIRKALKSRKTR